MQLQPWSAPCRRRHGACTLSRLPQKHLYLQRNRCAGFGFAVLHEGYLPRRHVCGCLYNVVYPVSKILVLGTPGGVEVHRLPCGALDCPEGHG